MRESEIEQWLSRRRRNAGALGALVLGSAVGEWRVEELLGRGRSAEVYRVTGVRRGGEAALKLLVDPALGQRFEFELALLSALRIDALPRLFGSGTHEGRRYYVMEYLHPLYLPLERSRILPFAENLARAVSSFNRAGYVHRDIKPGNVLLRPDGSCVLADLGLVRELPAAARLPDRPHPPGEMSVVGDRAVGVGTIGFAAPEQLLSRRVSVAADVFALGKMMKAAGALRIGAGARRIVFRATASDPEDRYPDADAFAAAVRRLRIWRRLAPLAVLLALAVSIVAAVVFARRYPPRAAAPAKALVAAVPETADSAAAPADSPAALLAAARAGDAEAQLRFAEALFHGRGVATNRAAAVEWYARAARQQLPDAIASLGYCKLHGLGTPADAAGAVALYRRAAALGHAGAMNDLAYCLLNGKGVPRDCREGFGWAMRSAGLGHPGAIAMVGECYMIGLGVERDAAKAESHLRRAAAAGNERARGLLTLLRARTSPAGEPADRGKNCAD